MGSNGLLAINFGYLSKFYLQWSIHIFELKMHRIRQIGFNQLRNIFGKSFCLDQQFVIRIQYSRLRFYNNMKVFFFLEEEEIIYIKQLNWIQTTNCTNPRDDSA